ncbi:MAG: amidohydrolase family protein [Thermoplasmata archaeon]
MDLAINNALIVTQNSNRDVMKGSILISGNRISTISKDKLHAEVEIDATGHALLPGFANTHAHAAMAHLKGRLDDIHLDNFLERTFDLDSKRTEDGIYNSSMLSMAEMLDSGITAFSDLYYSEDIIYRAAEKAGIRALLCWNTLDKDKTTQSGDPVNNAENFIRSYSGSDLIKPGIGVQGIYVAEDEVYHRSAEIAERYNTMVHTHLSETRKEVYDFEKKKGKRPIEHLAEISFLSPRVIAAHCVWATLNEVKILSKAKVNVSWNSVSNSKLGDGGIAPIPEMLDNQIRVSLGTDSNGSNNSLDMFQLMKHSSLLIKGQRWDASMMPAQTMLDMATINGYQSMGINDGGSVEPGKLADVILVNLKSPNMIPTDQSNITGNIVYSASPRNVDYTIVNGEIVKEPSGFVKFSVDDLIDRVYA